MKRAALFLALAAGTAAAAPTVTRLTPPSELFSSGRAAPVIARFLPGQRFDLQATIKPDAGQKITSARFLLDGKPVSANVALRDCASGCTKGLAAEAAIATVRAVSSEAAGAHSFSVEATQADGQKVVATGNFEVVPFTAAMGPKVKNIIILLGDGMGASQRTAARIVHGYAQGKALQPLAMDTFTATGMVKTSSLNSIVTDSSPGMTSYVSGNKNNNNEEGVFPDDTFDAFDNPRVEYLSEYLHRTQGKQLGIVTTADVFDATPAGNAVHTSNRGAGTGIVDQFFDDRAHTGLTVLMGGGRKWFLPAGTPGSARTDTNDYAFSATDAHTADIVKRWGVSSGRLDKGRDLIQEFQAAGFGYAPTKADLDKADVTRPLLGLFAFSNMNVALDKINGRRGTEKNGLGGGSVVEDFGLPDQPMLDEMAAKAIAVLRRAPKGFVLMIEGASIDKQAHAMDTERWMLDTLEFDRAVRVAQDFAAEQGDTLVIVTADHECSGAALIGGATVTDKALAELAAKKGVANLRNGVVGTYEKAGFPHYRIAADGYPETTDIDYRLLVGYGANADRYEDWRTKKTPQRDVQQPFVTEAPLKWYPANAQERDDALGEYLVTGQVPGEQAVHTATDVPLSAYGPGALAFTGVQDNTDVFFKLAQATVKGVVAPADTTGARKPPKPKR
ncbi:alkaline phosphatase [Roseateles cellulosilyticus]|uniref:Alkaline phosphatase n=1 Tax=Pelomonas cellulosilytica TaxID=2906762 RepID=A0ABS8XWR3_9BURK|nr:alkaline phosphatase [Pelomonas sp. P8]MCE4557096.1 alkaline phosphatase [Pelomonas sp. P8]